MRIFLIAVLGLVTLPSAVSAAVVQFDSNAYFPGVGEHVVVAVLIDSEHESINAIEGDILIPEGMEVVSIRRGFSIVPLWVEVPRIQNNRITFVGVIPGGWIESEQRNPRGELFTIVLTPKKEGIFTLDVSTSTRVFLNDGMGTQAKLESKPTSFLVRGVFTGEPLPTPDDVTPPEPFTPIIGRSDELYNGDYFIAFNTTDRESGLFSYEIAEVRGWVTPSRLSWRTASSPERLNDQTLQSTIYIKVIDQAGNERIVSVRSTNRSYAPLFLIVIIVILGLVVRYRERTFPLFRSFGRWG